MKIIGKIGNKVGNTLDLSDREKFKTFLKRIAERVKVA